MHLKHYMKFGIVPLFAVLLFALILGEKQAFAAISPKENTIEQVIAWSQQYRTGFDPGNVDTYAEQPSFESPYRAGRVSDQYIDSAINSIQFLRTLAGLSGSVKADDFLMEEAQRHAMTSAMDVMLQINKYCGAKPPEEWHTSRPVPDWSIDSTNYQTYSGGIGGSFGNLHTINEYRTNYLSMFDLFDDGVFEDMLIPGEVRVGFGYASTSTSTYTEVARRQMSFDDFDTIAWPSAGAFPTEVFTSEDMWSIRLNSDKYGPLSKEDIQLTVTRTNDGKVWKYDASTSNKWFQPLHDTIYFKPDSGLFTDADQYKVEISGVKDIDGNEVQIRYNVNFFNIPPNAMVKQYIAEWKERLGKPLASPNKVVFKDKGLENDVREMMHRPQGAITEEELARLEILEIYYKMTDTSILSKFKNVRVLYLRSDLPDFAFLKDMKYLQNIEFGGSEKESAKFTDAVSNTELPYLTSFSTMPIKLNSLDKLVSHLPNLRTLALRSDDVRSLKPISKLADLEHLYIASGNMTDLDTLPQLKQLNNLSLDFKGKGNPAPVLQKVVPQLTKLNRLLLENAHLSSVSFLSNLTQITELGLKQNQIQDISPLKALNNMHYLYLSGNRISDLSALSSMDQLVDLNLADNQISNLSGLSSLKQLGSLKLSGNRLKDISMLNLTNGIPYYWVSVKDNFLDLTPGSSAMKVVSEYKKQNTTFVYETQRKVTLDSININHLQQTGLSLPVSGSTAIQAYAVYNDGTEKAVSLSALKLESADPKIVQISKGKMVGVKRGTTRVKATYQDVSCTIVVQVGS